MCFSAEHRISNWSNKKIETEEVKEKNGKEKEQSRNNLI